MENNILDGPVMPAEGAAYRDSTYELVSKVATNRPNWMSMRDWKKIKTQELSAI